MLSPIEPPLPLHRLVKYRDGTSSDGSFPTAISSAVFPEGIGDAGDIEIITNNLNITNGAQISSSTFGK